MRKANRSIGVVAVCLVLIGVSGAFAQDWPQWRGANRDGGDGEPLWRDAYAAVEAIRSIHPSTANWFEGAARGVPAGATETAYWLPARRELQAGLHPRSDFGERITPPAIRKFYWPPRPKGGPPWLAS